MRGLTSRLAHQLWHQRAAPVPCWGRTSSRRRAPQRLPLPLRGKNCPPRWPPEHPRPVPRGLADPAAARDSEDSGTGSGCRPVCHRPWRRLSHCPPSLWLGGWGNRAQRGQAFPWAAQQGAAGGGPSQPALELRPWPCRGRPSRSLAWPWSTGRFAFSVISFSSYLLSRASDKHLLL